MKLREYLNAADIYLFMIIMSTTFLISIYSISNYIFSNSGGFNKTVMLYLYFTTGTGRETVIFTGIFFILSLFIILILTLDFCLAYLVFRSLLVPLSRTTQKEFLPGSLLGFLPFLWHHISYFSSTFHSILFLLPYSLQALEGAWDFQKF